MFFPTPKEGYTRIRNAKTGKYHSIQSGRYLDIIREIYDNPETVVYVPRSEVVEEGWYGITDLTRFMSRIRRSTGLDITAYCVAPEGQRPYGDNVIGYEIKLNKS
jgi:hypothetical protein